MDYLEFCVSEQKHAGNRLVKAVWIILGVLQKACRQQRQCSKRATCTPIREFCSSKTNPEYTQEDRCESLTFMTFRFINVSREAPPTLLL